MTYIPSPTSGLSVAAKVSLDVATVALSVTGATYNGTTYPETHQLVAKIVDAAGTVQEEGTSLVLTSVDSSIGATAVYHGTITGGGTNAFVGRTFDVAGFVTHTVNNGTFECTASSSGSGTLTLTNAAAVAETHAATAISEDSPYPITYVSYDSAQASVSSSGLITAVKAGQALVEASYPTFDNSVGDIVSSGNIMNGLPIVKIYGDVVVQVYP